MKRRQGVQGNLVAAHPPDRGSCEWAWVELVAASSRKSVRLRLSPGAPAPLAPSPELVPVGESGAPDSPPPPGAFLRLVGTRVLVSSSGTYPVAVNGLEVGSEAKLGEGDWLAVGDALLRVERIQLGARSGTQPSAIERAGPSPAADGGSYVAITIGRFPGNTIRISSPLVSRRHALLRREPDSWVIEDLGSTNGTFVNASRIQGRMPLRGGEHIQIGSASFRFQPDTPTLLAPVRTRGGIHLECRDLGRTVRDRRGGTTVDILAGIDLVLQAGEFVGIFGTSGCGKSTLLDALSARRPATRGSVFYNGRDLAASFDMLRCLIAYVPQQDIVHRGIPVSKALGYTARLRLPPDTSKAEIDSRVRNVLHRIGLADKANAIVNTPAPLSGGQLKRVSVATELVSEPSILFLDEVTSGLDAATDRHMMQLFRDLAREGRTVVCVTHSLENIDFCDHVILLHHGRVAFFGPPDEARRFFGVSRLVEVYECIQRDEPERLAARYRSSSLFRELVVDRRWNAEATPDAASSNKVGRPGAFDLRQVRILTTRYVDLIWRDRANLAVLLCQAPLVALVIGLVFEIRGPLASRAAAHRTIAFLAVLSSVWFGCLNSAREIVKERAIYERERAINLGIGSYLASKVGPLAALAAVQSGLFLGALHLILPLSLPLVGGVAVLFLTNLAAVGLGLVVSAIAGSSDRAVAAVPILLVPQAVLADAIVRLGGPSEWGARVFAIAYWSFAGIEDLLPVALRSARSPLGEPVFFADFGVWQASCALFLFFGVYLGVAAGALRMREACR